MAYTRWSDDEKRKMVERVHALTIQYGYTVPYQPGVLLGLSREAQLCLPKSRQRDIAATLTVAWIEEAVLERMTKPLAAHEGSADKIVATIPKAVVTHKLKNAESVWELIQNEVRKTPIIQTLVESISEQIADDIHANVVRKLLSRGIAVEDKPASVPVAKKPEPVQKPPVPAAPVTPAVAKQPKQKQVKIKSLSQLNQLALDVKKPGVSERPPELKTIVVCGLYAEQADILKREFMGKAIVHVPFVEHLAEHDVAKNADVVFLITNKINHTNEGYMRKFVPKERFKYVSGNGLSAVKRDIYRYLEANQTTI